VKDAIVAIAILVLLLTGFWWTRGGGVARGLDRLPQRWRQTVGTVLCALWALFQLLVAVLAGTTFAYDLSASGSEDREPTVNLILTALTTLVALIGLGAALQHLFGRRRLGAGGELSLALATLLVLFVAVFAGFASGPH
jgi:hypothetical protein